MVQISKLEAVHLVSLVIVIFALTGVGSYRQGKSERMPCVETTEAPAIETLQEI
jgi:hypothetical protein